MFLQDVAYFTIVLAEFEFAEATLVDPNECGSLNRGHEVWRVESADETGSQNHIYLRNYRERDVINGFLLLGEIQAGDKLKVSFIKTNEYSGALSQDPGWLHRIEVSRGGSKFKEIFSRPLEHFVLQEKMSDLES